MINFRYHVVSLISVFLALAVGIILGAGPLKESIGNQLSGQVSALRSEKEDLRTQLQQSKDQSDQRESGVSALAPAVLSGTLTDVDVTVIQVSPGLDDEFKALSTQLTTAGATVRGRIEVTDTWLTPAGSEVLDQTAPKVLATELGVDGTATSSQQVAQALALSLATIEPTATGGTHLLSSSASATLADLKSAGLISLDRTPKVASSAIVILDGPTTTDKTPATPGSDAVQSYTTDREKEIVKASHSAIPDTVVTGPSDDTQGIVDAVRHDGDLQVAVSTVSGSDTLIGQVSVALALADQSAGNVGHYGFDDGATTPIPAIPPARTPASDESEQHK